MGLDEYQRKRDFERTREPRGKVARGRAEKKRSAERLQFVIQKHAARNLHYDFRLELDGVLKSWAVPKGPSLVPTERRMAAQVEDHPLEYGGFEGVIPKGEYGGGSVVVWDRGTWEPIGDPRAGMRQGKLKFRLHGEKLQGEWVLVRTGGPADDGKEHWFLIKRDDEHADPSRDIVAEQPQSVVTGRKVEEVGADADRTWTRRGEGPRKVRRGPDASKVKGAR